MGMAVRSGESGIIAPVLVVKDLYIPERHRLSVTGTPLSKAEWCERHHFRV